MKKKPVLNGPYCGACGFLVYDEECALYGGDNYSNRDLEYCDKTDSDCELLRCEECVNEYKPDFDGQTMACGYCAEESDAIRLGCCIQGEALNFKKCGVVKEGKGTK